VKTVIFPGGKVLLNREDWVHPPSNQVAGIEGELLLLFIVQNRLAIYFCSFAASL
jgi:hypothetical protein